MNKILWRKDDQQSDLRNFNFQDLTCSFQHVDLYHIFIRAILDTLLYHPILLDLLLTRIVSITLLAPTEMLNLLV